MKNQKDELIQLSPQQSNPGSARASDFTVNQGPLPVAGHGQHGQTRAEEARMIREGLNTLGKSPSVEIPR